MTWRCLVAFFLFSQPWAFLRWDGGVNARWNCGTINIHCTTSSKETIRGRNKICSCLHRSCGNDEISLSPSSMTRYFDMIWTDCLHSKVEMLFLQRVDLFARSSKYQHSSSLPFSLSHKPLRCLSLVVFFFVLGLFAVALSMKVPRMPVQTGPGFLCWCDQNGVSLALFLLTNPTTYVHTGIGLVTKGQGQPFNFAPVIQPWRT